MKILLFTIVIIIQMLPLLDDYQKAYMQREFGPDAAYTDLYLRLRSAALFWGDIAGQREDLTWLIKMEEQIRPNVSD